MVAKGLSNKQIAAKLVVSERTVDAHILNLLNKLGVNSSTQIASWVTANEPPNSIKPYPRAQPQDKPRIALGRDPSGLP